MNDRLWKMPTRRPRRPPTPMGFHSSWVLTWYKVLLDKVRDTETTIIGFSIYGTEDETTVKRTHAL
jgi:hypothetical protein